MLDFVSDAYLLRWLGACLLMAVLLGGFALTLQRGHWQYFRAHQANRAPKRIQVVESQFLTPKHRLVLFKVDNTEHVILLGPNGDTPLHKAPLDA